MVYVYKNLRRGCQEENKDMLQSSPQKWRTCVYRILC